MTVRRAISRKSLPDLITEDLRERILSGNLAEGTTIRQEALADEYDVSRMPIREALKRLDAQGLVQLSTNRGATVTRHSLGEIAEIFELRTLIEVDLFRHAIPRLTPADVERCETILGRMEAAYDTSDVANWGKLNAEYHAALYAPARRKLTQDTLEPLNQQCDRYIRMQLSVMKQTSRAHDEHRSLLRLASAGEVDKACALLSAHITHAKEQLLDYVSAKRRDEGKAEK